MMHTRRELVKLKAENEDLKQLVHGSNQRILNELATMKSMMAEFMGHGFRRDQKKRKLEGVS
jgi:hypothetical protein